ncbi:outer dynein arm-docking complex subunit 3-like [Hyla sarda]|uniref:outer dynein arm-docking complex subunit 3-like n=1 Tax=Hyla sarda TaxID=327740 RepID=UPI0024C38279|nr:outer dynein arm-docking complex subunit 3-like [Hyla sarda]
MSCPQQNNRMLTTSSTCVERCKMVSSGQKSRAETKKGMAGTPSLPGIKSPIKDQMVSVQKKTQLLEFDHKVYQESVSHTIKKHKETIQLLQQQNEKINWEIALEKKRQADRETQCGQAITQLKEDKLHDSIKRLNALCYQVQVRKKHLEGLESQLNRNDTVMQNSKITQEEQMQRFLESKLEEASIKFQDVKHINSVYGKMITHLQEELPTFPTLIQQLNPEILLFRNELKEVRIMKKNMIMSRDTARAQHKHQKKEYRHNRRNKEQILRALTHQIKKIRRYEKERDKSGVFKRPHATIDVHKVPPAEKGEERIHVYKEALKKIKKATGACTKGELLQRFIKQGETRKHLEKEKIMTEQSLSELKDKQTKMDNALKELKYSSQAPLQAKLSNNLKTLEELQTQLQLESEKHDKLKMEAEETREILHKATSEVKLLARRLQYIMVPGTNLSVTDLSPDIPALDLLTIIGQKLQKLQKQLEAQNKEDIFKEMNEKKRNLPTSKLPISLLPAIQDSSDEDSDEEWDEMRASIKKISHQITKSNAMKFWSNKWVKQ